MQAIVAVMRKLLHSIHGMFALRQSASKLVFGSGSGGWSKGSDDNAPVQLYDMAQDTGERQNRQGAGTADVARLTALMEKITADGRSTPGQPQKCTMSTS